MALRQPDDGDVETTPSKPPTYRLSSRRNRQQQNDESSEFTYSELETPGALRVGGGRNDDDVLTTLMNPQEDPTLVVAAEIAPETAAAAAPEIGDIVQEVLRQTQLAQQQQQQQHDVSTLGASATTGTPPKVVVSAEKVVTIKRICCGISRTWFVVGVLILALVAALAVTLGVLLLSSQDGGTNYNSTNGTTDGAAILAVQSSSPTPSLAPVVSADVDTTTALPTIQAPAVIMMVPPTKSPSPTQVVVGDTSQPTTTTTTTPAPTESPTFLSPTGGLPTTEFPTVSPTFVATTKSPTIAPAIIMDQGTAISFSTTLEGRNNNDDDDLFGHYIEFSRDGMTMAVGAPGSNTPYVRIFRKSSRESNDDWVRIGQTMEVVDVGGGGGDNNNANIKFGHRVELSEDGNTVVIGSPNAYNGQGAVFVYDYNNGSDAWISRSEIGELVGRVGGAQMGWDVAISNDGNTIAATAIGAEYVQVWVYAAASHMLWTTLNTFEGEMDGDAFGRSVDLSSSGQRIAIGAVTGGSGKGRIYVYDYDEATDAWTSVGQVLDGINVDDWQGTSVALSSAGNYLAVGADGHDENGSNSGMVRVYELIGCCSWTQYGNTIYGKAEGDQLGAGQVSLSTNGQLLAVGANHYNEDRGKAYLYKYEDGSWNLAGSVVGDTAGDRIGFSASVSGDGSVFAAGARGYLDVYNIIV